MTFTEHVVSRSIGRLLAVLLVAALGAGCTGGLIGPSNAPSTLYHLQAPSDFPETLDTPPWQLIIEEPLAKRAIDTNRMAIYDGPYALKYLADARWSDRAPRMVRDLITESFEYAGMQESTGRQTVAVQSNVALISDLRDFQARISSAGTASAQAVVTVRISAKLVWLDGQTVLAGAIFKAQENAPSDTPADVAAAMNTALQQVIRELVIWSTETASENLPAS